MFLIFSCLFIICVVSTPLIDALPTEYSRYLYQYHKNYKTEQEIRKHYVVFKESVRDISLINKSNFTWKAGLTFFSDIPTEELPRSNTNYSIILPTKVVKPNLRKTFLYPESIDWNEKGRVSPPIDQGECNAAYAIAAVKSVESVYAILYNNMTLFSTQQVIDCSQSYGNLGCKSGSIFHTYEYFTHNNGLCSSEEYPYNATQGTCNTTCIQLQKIYAYNHNAEFVEEAVLRIIVQQPIILSINLETIKNYKNGIIADKCKGDPDVEMLLVGYGKENDVPYWKLQAPFGDQWGENGFIRVAKDVGGPGWCGLARTVFYPVV